MSVTVDRERLGRDRESRRTGWQAPRCGWVGPGMEPEQPASAQDLAVPPQGEPGVADSSEIALGAQGRAGAAPTLPAQQPRSLGRKKAHEVCAYRPPLWSMSLGDPHGQWLKSDVAARSKIRSSKCACTPVLRLHAPSPT